MFIVKCKASFLKLPLKKAAVVFLVAFFSISAYGQKFYLAYEPKIPEHSHAMYYGPISDSEFLYGTSSSEGSSSYSQKIYLYRLENHSSTQLLEVRIPTLEDYLPLPRMQFIKDKFKSYIIANGKLIVSDGTPDNTKILKSFGTRYCCGFNGSNMSRISFLRIIDGNLYFSYEDSINTDDPYRQYINSMSIWKTDGTQLGTRQISRSINDYSTGHFLGNVFINQSVAPNTAFYFSKGGLWKSSQNTKPFITLGDDLTKSFIRSRTVTTTRGNFMCGPNYRKSGKALWRFSNSGKFEIIANGCDAIINTFSNSVFYTIGNQLWETDGTSLGERKLLDLTKNQNRISACQINGSSFLNFSYYNSKNTKFIKIDKNGIIEDLSSLVNFNLGENSNISCIKDKILFSWYQRPQHHVSYLLFNPANKQVEKVIKRKPKQVENSNKNFILAQSREYLRPFLLSETAPPFLPSTLLLFDED